MRNPLRLATVLSLCLAPALAVDFGALQPQGYVSDFAGVVQPQARVELEHYCGVVEKSTGAQIALVTLPTLEGEPVEDVANLLFRKWGVGQKGNNEGILLLLAVRDRRSRLEVGYGLEPNLPDGFAGSILRDMRPALRENNFGAALAAAAEAIGSRVAAAKGVRLEEAPLSRRRPQRGTHIPWPLMLGGLGLLLWLLKGGGGGGGILPALILGNMMGRSLGGRGGGGFGGFDSGDSFGGFGGGDSGGGGASSDW